MAKKPPQIELEGESIAFKAEQKYGFSVEIGLWGPSSGQFSHFNLNRYTRTRMMRVLREAIDGGVSLLPTNSNFGHYEAMLLLTPEPDDPEYIWVKVLDCPDYKPSFEYLGLVKRSDLERLYDFIEKYAI